MGLQDYKPEFASLDESINRLHWPDVIKDLEQMRTLEEKEPEDTELRQLLQRPHEKQCRHCQIASARLRQYQSGEADELYLTA